MNQGGIRPGACMGLQADYHSCHQPTVKALKNQLDVYQCWAKNTPQWNSDITNFIITINIPSCNASITP